MVANFIASYYKLGLKSRSKVELQDTWASEIHTYLGLMISDYPNLFTVFGPQGMQMCLHILLNC
jgi:cation diffusion facilitator CzcD-associated flavoprotein CzcO